MNIFKLYSGEFMNDGNGIYHKSMFKTLINPLLRFFQIISDEPYLFVSVCNIKNGEGKFVCYRFERCCYNKIPQRV